LRIRICYGTSAILIHQQHVILVKAQQRPPPLQELLFKQGLHKKKKKKKKTRRRERDHDDSSSYQHYRGHHDDFQSRINENVSASDSRSSGSTNSRSSSRMNAGDFDISKLIHMILGPRDIVQGIKQAIITASIGILASFCAILGIPYAIMMHSSSGGSFQQQGSAGGGDGSAGGGMLIVGVLLGTFGSMAFMFVTFATILFQIILGVVNTPRAIFASCVQGKRWDDNARQWTYYSLQDEERSLFHRYYHHDNDSSVNDAASFVVDTTFYDLLGVTPRSSSKDIKRAYFLRAKALHPDKNPENIEAATDEFINLHKAYQILIDPKTRSNYDRRGQPSSATAAGDGHGGGGMNEYDLDADAFFQILFGSQLVETYVGQFNFVYLVQLLQELRHEYQQLSENSTDPIDVSNHWQRYNLDKRKRYVGVARNLLKRIALFVENKVSRKKFYQSCIEEADVIASHDFGEYYLYVIGNELLHASRKWPSSRFHSRSMKRIKVLQSLIDLIRIRAGPPVLVEQQELLIPQIIQVMWLYIDHEVMTTIREASFRVLHESSEMTKSERRRRALALGVIGKVFLERGKERRGPWTVSKAAGYQI
jgi:DnaJ-class molecular chaperone with C-terminal Zn finger domain